MRVKIALALLAAAVPALPLVGQGPRPEPETVAAIPAAPRLPELPVLPVDLAVVPVELPSVPERAVGRSPAEELTRAYLASLDDLFAREPDPARARELFALRERVRAAARIVVR